MLPLSSFYRHPSAGWGLRRLGASLPEMPAFAGMTVLVVGWSKRLNFADPQDEASFSVTWGGAASR